jgi:adenylate cyclase
LPASAYISLLNGYFECAAGAVLEAGGEVLNYIGDGVLAIFPIGEMSEEDAAAAALDAAKEARRRLKDVNENLQFMGREPLEFGIALHVGDVVFGNIGSGGRLAFTTIGAAVNEVARLEALTKSLDARILMSGEFKSAVTRADPAVPLKSFGFQKMRGIGAPIDVFGYDSSASEA